MKKIANIIVSLLCLSGCANCGVEPEPKFVNPLFYKVLDSGNLDELRLQLTPTKMIKTYNGDPYYVESKCWLLENTENRIILQCITPNPWLESNIDYIKKNPGLMTYNKIHEFDIFPCEKEHFCYDGIADVIEEEFDAKYYHNHKTKTREEKRNPRLITQSYTIYDDHYVPDDYKIHYSYMDIYKLD